MDFQLTWCCVGYFVALLLWKQFGECGKKRRSRQRVSPQAESSVTQFTTFFYASTSTTIFAYIFYKNSNFICLSWNSTNNKSLLSPSRAHFSHLQNSDEAANILDSGYVTARLLSTPARRKGRKIAVCNPAQSPEKLNSGYLWRSKSLAFMACEVS